MDTYQPVLNISVMPWSTKNLAPSIWHQLYLQTVREREVAHEFSSGSAWSQPAKVCMVLFTVVALLNGLGFVI